MTLNAARDWIALKIKMFGMDWMIFSFKVKPFLLAPFVFVANLISGLVWAPGWIIHWIGKCLERGRLDWKELIP